MKPEESTLLPWICTAQKTKSLNLLSFFKFVYIYSEHRFTSVIPSYRELQEIQAYWDLQESPDWQAYPDPWDLLGHLDLPDPLDRVIMLDL